MNINAPLFLRLGDQRVNMQHVQVIQPIPDASAPCGVKVTLDTGSRTFSWLPQTKEELEWLDTVIGVLAPGTCLHRFGDTSADETVECLAILSPPPLPLPPLDPLDPLEKLYSTPVLPKELKRNLSRRSN